MAALQVLGQSCNCLGSLDVELFVGLLLLELALFLFGLLFGDRDRAVRPSLEPITCIIEVLYDDILLLAHQLTPSPVGANRL